MKKKQGELYKPDGTLLNTEQLDVRLTKLTDQRYALTVQTCCLTAGLHHTQTELVKLRRQDSQRSRGIHMTKTEALVLLADALKESKQLHQLRFLVAEFTLAVAQHKDGKMSTQQLIARLRNLAHIEALSQQEEEPKP